MISVLTATCYELVVAKDEAAAYIALGRARTLSLTSQSKKKRRAIDLRQDTRWKEGTNHEAYSVRIPSRCVAAVILAGELVNGITSRRHRGVLARRFGSKKSEACRLASMLSRVHAWPTRTRPCAVHSLAMPQVRALGPMLLNESWILYSVIPITA